MRRHQRPGRKRRANPKRLRVVGGTEARPESREPFRAFVTAERDRLIAQGMAR